MQLQAGTLLQHPNIIPPGALSAAKPGKIRQYLSASGSALGARSLCLPSLNASASVLLERQPLHAQQPHRCPAPASGDSTTVRAGKGSMQTQCLKLADIAIARHRTGPPLENTACSAADARLAGLGRDGVLFLGQAAQHAPTARLAQVGAALLHAQRVDVRLARHVQPVVQPAAQQGPFSGLHALRPSWLMGPSSLASRHATGQQVDAAAPPYHIKRVCIAFM